MSPGTTIRTPQILGADLATEATGISTLFAIDDKRPRYVVKPSAVQEIVSVIEYAGAEKLAVVATGGRSKLEIGGTPARYDIALDVSGLDRIISYDPGDLTLSVEAGCRLSEANKTLAEHGQFLPLARPFADRATVGGMIASGIDSPLRQRYGTARDFVLGMEFVTGDGKLAKSGGRVVKNVTGYDLHKLMIGSLGTLGILTRINFRTFPIPSESLALIAQFNSLTPALELCHRIVNSPLSPLTLDIRSSNGGWELVTGFAGSGAVKARYERELLAMAHTCDARDSRILTKEEWQKTFQAVRDFVPSMLKASPAVVIIKLGVVPRQMGAACESAAEIAEKAQLRWAAMARGVGVIYFVMSAANQTEESKAAAVRAAAEISTATTQLGGHSTIPWAPSAWKDSLQIWGSPRPDLALMKKVKSIFDPLAILSPGRFVGGL